MSQTNLFETSTVDSFLEEVWMEISNHSHNPANTYIILPSVRAGLFFKNIYRKQAGQSMILPNITTIHNFIDQFSPIKTLDSHAALFELYHCYKEIRGHEAENFPEFYKWARLLLNDFNEIDNYLTDPYHLYSNLRNLKELEDWSFNLEELSTNQLQFIGFWDRLLPLYLTFEKHLHTLGKAYSGKKVRWFANDIDRFIDTNSDLQLYFVGFNALNRAEERIIEALGTSGLATVFWDIDPYYHQNPDQEAGKFFPKKDGTPYYRFIEGKMKTHEQEINIIGVPKGVGQVKTAAQLLDKIPDREYPDTALVLANESLLLPFLNSIPDKVRTANLTMGLPLKLNPIYSLLESLFDFNAAITAGSAPAVVIKKITEHQFLNSHFDPSIALNNFLGKKRFIPIDRLTDHLSGPLELALFLYWNNQVELAVSGISAVLNELKNRYAALQLSAFENEFLYETTKAVVRISEVIRTYNDLVDLSIFKRLLFDELKNKKVAFIGDPISGLQVMGMLETRALDFQNLIVLGANEGYMPAAPAESSLIPGELKRHYGLPTYEKREAIYAYYVYRLLHRSKKVTFIYNNVVDDLGGNEKSRFLLQLTEELPKLNPKVHIHQQQAWGEARVDSGKNHEVVKNPAVIEKIKALLAKGVSPTALSTFLECPLNFYYKYIIGLSEAETTDEVSASEFGSLVHKAIELAFANMENQVLDINFYNRIIKATDTLCFQALEDTMNNIEPEGKTLISLELARHQFRQLMETEKKQLINLQKLGQTTCFLGSEKNIDHRFTIEVNNEKIPVQVIGKIDRIHQTGNCVWIIDYKTGKVEEKELKIQSFEDLQKSEKRKALQLAIYGWAMKKSYPQFELITGIVSTVKPTEKPYVLVHNGEPIMYSDETVGHIQNALTGIMNDLLDPAKPFIHNTKSRFCHYC